mmetsp:Transcript_3344/g.8286  ORF Transcript_3344/g.8286 Transcript_3344/m.8286 type:complete len:223 (+) Transcript_3344:916-1584(+)
MPCTSLGHVALHSSVCLSGRIWLTIFFIWGSKPMSSMRSASSSTRKDTCESLHEPSFTRSSSRPGVATTISTPTLSALTWCDLGTPPYAHSERILHAFPASSSTSWIWHASSRVGAMASMMGRPLPHCSPSTSRAWICAMPGTPNASVFPDPVDAMPTRSRPDSTTGQLCAWMADGSLKPDVQAISAGGSPTCAKSMMGAMSQPSTVMSNFWRTAATSCALI